MARRRTSPFEDIIEIAARFPWWVGCGLAVVSYLLLHSYANTDLAKTNSSGQMVGLGANIVFVSLAKFGQFLLPIAFCAGAVVSFVKGQHRKTLYNRVKSKGDPDVLFDMNWREFELVVGESFRHGGYQVKETGGNGPDEGVDLILSKDGEKYLVQCKQWKALKVGVQPVRELYGVMAAKGAVGGYVITAGEFTKDARAFVTGLNIKLVDGAGLHRMIKNVRQNAPISPLTPQESATPVCPKCKEPMLRRTARQGQNIGNEFWGCTKFPACRGVRPV